jgi:hypothetical protein
MLKSSRFDRQRFHCAEFVIGDGVKRGFFDPPSSIAMSIWQAEFGP